MQPQQMTPEQASWFGEATNKLVANIEQAVVGKTHVVRLALTCLLSDGHLLLEDYPGTGKTSLAKSVANSVQGTHSRIQFTPDLLPTDVTGVSIYESNRNTFEFHPGPIFATIVLADEINRASPKTQSALLEVMDEGRVTVDGEPHPVGAPFMVVATMNPIEQAGTYRLPEAQLDRFLIKTSLGYPDRESTRHILAESATRDRSIAVGPIITASAVVEMTKVADLVHVDESILDYVSRLAEQSRRSPHVRLGTSVRGCLAWVRTAKTWAAIHGRHYVIPDDVQELAVPVLSHRILLDAEAEFGGIAVADVIRGIIDDVAPPSERVA